ncbi:glycosyltransferase [Providencia rettgeri]|uniref:glycosyltransferase family 2 protein n=1 Tax=Providencia sp. PROV200 TaxID=2936794 RepID=UPI001BD22D49|nr:glycosyltransferase family 2 protein [Providencia rettgeri]
MNNRSVNILLATYNGEKYLHEQINSLLDQSYSNFTVLISDDGSSDGTINVLSKIKDPRFKIINTQRIGGVIKNFEFLLSKSDADYVMLCDQDDVWHPNKIHHSLNEITKNEEDKDTPCLGFSDLELVNENLELISDSFYAKTGLNPYRNFNIDNLSWMGSIYGCTIIMNRASVNNALPFPENLIMHDHWLGFRTLSIGNIFYINKALLKYRQHENNVAGGMGYKKNIIQKILSPKKYRDIRDRAIIISRLHNIKSLKDKLVFSKVILRSFKYCETKKYPLLFLLTFLIYG